MNPDHEEKTEAQCQLEAYIEASLWDERMQERREYWLWERPVKKY